MQAKISDIKVEKAVNDKGLICFVSFTYNNQIRFQKISVYSRLDGGIRLSFPEKDKGIKRIKLAYPINDNSRIQIESQIYKFMKSEGYFNENRQLS